MARGSSVRSGLPARAPAAMRSSSPAARSLARKREARSVRTERCTAHPPTRASRSSSPAVFPAAPAAGHLGNRTVPRTMDGAKQ
jgi:hypothetical protein